MTSYESDPWYVKPTLRNKYGPSTWAARIMGLPVPGDEGVKFAPSGYKIAEVGPETMKGMGREVMEKDQERIARVRGGGCPFGRVKVE